MPTHHTGRGEKKRKEGESNRIKYACTRTRAHAHTHPRASKEYSRAMSISRFDTTCTLRGARNTRTHARTHAHTDLPCDCAWGSTHTCPGYTFLPLRRTHHNPRR